MSDGPQPRLYTFEEARAAMPEVRERTREAVDEIEALSYSFSGDETDEEREARIRNGAEEVLVRWAEDIRAMGLEVKGPWLVDFDSGGGYYCWRWPEESLQYFHGYDEGFAGRVRLQ